MSAGLAIEAIQVDAQTSVVLNDRHGIEIRQDSQRTSVSVGVVDTDKLRKALFDMSVIQAEYQDKAEREARSSEPIDQPTRKAIFAALTEVYGSHLNNDSSRAERLTIISKLAGRQIYSLSERRGNMTMADAHRVLDILGTLVER